MALYEKGPGGDIHYHFENIENANFAQASGGGAAIAGQSNSVADRGGQISETASPESTAGRALWIILTVVLLLLIAAAVVLGAVGSISWAAALGAVVVIAAVGTIVVVAK